MSCQSSARTDGVRQVDQRRFALEPDDAVQFRNELEGLLIAQAGKVPAHREVALNAAGPKEAHQLAVATDVELEDQRKPDEDRIDLPTPP